jgi:hypothetical protein
VAKASAARRVIIRSCAAPAYADATVFIGTATTPSNRSLRGISAGLGFLIVAFEFEYARIAESEEDAAPGLKTGMGHILLQSPVELFGMQPYVTTGAGIYRETLGDTFRETNIGLSTGGGVKVSLLGPIRARFDYRVLKLRGDPLHSVVHRLYAGLNLKF